jgi:LSD1 subclass zinc finger protein
MEYILLICVLMAGVGMAISSAKNRSLIEGALLGGLLGCFGLIIVAVLPKQLPKPPPGMRAVLCPRCNAPQNILQDAVSFECWQCHTTAPTGVQKAIQRVKAKDPAKTKQVVCPGCEAKLMIKPTTKKYRCHHCDTVSPA